jgi:hypothetical protein
MKMIGVISVQVLGKAKIPPEVDCEQHDFSVNVAPPHLAAAKTQDHSYSGETGDRVFLSDFSSAR